MPIRTNVKEVADLRMANMARRPRRIAKAVSKHGKMILLLPNGQWWWEHSAAHVFNNCDFSVDSTYSRYFTLLKALVEFRVLSQAAFNAFLAEVKANIIRERHRNILWELRQAHKRYGLTLKPDAKLRAYEKLIGEPVYRKQR